MQVFFVDCSVKCLAKLVIFYSRARSGEMLLILLLLLLLLLFTKICCSHIVISRYALLFFMCLCS